MAKPRHGRQARLPEIGEQGQDKLARSALVVRGSGAAAQVEARYLAGAGVGALTVPEPATAEAARAVDPSVRVRIAPAAQVPEQVAPAHVAPASSSVPEQVAPAHFAPASLSVLGLATAAPEWVVPGWIEELAPGPREVAHGAYLALLAIREAIGDTTDARLA